MKKIVKKEKLTNNFAKKNGITLIALVVTIVVLLILSGITINMLFGSDGIFNIANSAKEQYKIGVLKDRINNVIADWSIERLTKPGITVDDLWGKMVEADIISNPVEDYVEGPEKEGENDVYQVTTNEGYVVEIIVMPDGSVVIGDVVKGDSLPPKIVSVETTSGTNNIQLTVTMSRWENGTISYYYKKDGEEDVSYKPYKEDTTELTANIEGLEQNVVYNIKIVAENENGSTEKVVNETTGELKEGTITQKGPTVWSSGTASIELETTETGVSIQYQIDGMEGVWLDYEGPITGLNHGQTVYAIITDGNNISGHTSIDILDEEEPTVNVTEGTKTTNSIQVSVTSSDAEWGMPETVTYNYYIKTSGGSYQQTANHTGPETSYTFTGLTQNTSYDVKVTTVDKAGNPGEGEATNITTGTVGGASEDLREGNIVATEPTWQNGTASITLSKGTGVASNLTIQYQIGGIEGNWTTVQEGTNPVTVTNLQHGNVVYARLTDGTNVGSYASVDILDEEAPTVNVTEGTKTTNSIQVNISASDAEWGMPETPIYNYYIKTSSGSYPQTANHTGAETSYTFTGLTQNTSYDVKVTTSDKAGNLGQGEATNITTGTVGGASEDLREGNIVATEPTWQNGIASITLSKGTGVASSLTIQYQIGGIEGNWTTAQEGANSVTVTNLQHGNVVYARLTDGTNNGSYASVTILDEVSPTVNLSTSNITSRSATLKVTASDGQSGLATTGTYKYYLGNTLKTTSTNNSYTYTNLSDGTNYTLKVVVTDKVGKTTEKTTTVTTLTVPAGTVSGAITFGSTTWTSEGASITVRTNTSYTIQYQVNSTTGTWKTVSNGGKITGLKDGDIVYARLTDGINNGNHTSTNIIDNTVARIGDNYYTTLQSAINAVPTNNVETTVILLKNVTESIRTKVNQNIILNLNNHTLNSSDITLTNEGKIKITGGTITATDLYAIFNEAGGVLEISETAYISSSWDYVTVFNRGEARISGGTITSTNGNAIGNEAGGVLEISGTANITTSTNFITVSNRGEMRISGGTITSTSTNDSAITNYEGGVLEIIGGTITSQNSLAINNQEGGTLEISGTANISSSNANNYPTVYNYGEATISGGTITARNSYGLWNLSGGIATISGGTITSQNSYGVYNQSGAQITITGGYISSRYGC